MDHDRRSPPSPLKPSVSAIPDSQPESNSVVSLPIKALLMGYYGMGNLGDEMMLFCLKSWLTQQGFRLTVLSERPDAVEKDHGLPAVENAPIMGEWAWRTSWFKGGAWRVIRALSLTDVLIVGGGDLVRDDLGWRTFFYTIEKFMLARLLRKKIYVVNVGIGQPVTRYGRIILSWVLAGCDRIIVRDTRSEEICKQLGMNSAVVLAPDIVLSIPDLLTEPSSALAAKPPARPYIVVCLRHNPNVFRVYDMNAARIRTLARALDEVVDRRGVDVVFIPFQEDPESGRGDNQLNEIVAQEMIHRDRTDLRPWTADINEICRWIRGAQFVVAMRLHAAVLARAYNRPSVLMPCDRKITEFGKLMNIGLTIEAALLDDFAQTNSVLENACLEAQEEKTDTLRTEVTAAWAELRLQNAGHPPFPEFVRN